VLVLVLVFPLLSAYAESFTVSTNKDMYTVDEKAIIVGVVPDEAPEGYAILVKVEDANGQECYFQNILPNSDHSFVSRPVALEECGPGEFTVFAFYAEMAANSTFTVSNSSQSSAGNKLELRLLKNVVMQAQYTVNQRIKEFIEANNVLPEDIADKYSQGVSEASLVLQAIDFGNTAEAKKHLIFSIRHLREVIDALSAERAINQAIELQVEANDDKDALLERYDRLKEFYFRLEELAQKNGVEKDLEFGTIVSFLARSKQMIDKDDLESAASNLERVNQMLEAIRHNLFEEERSSDSKAEHPATYDEDQARRLTSAADKFEKKAYNLLNDSDSEAANLKIEECLELISRARVSIDEGSYESARNVLSDAYKALNDAKEILEEDGDGSKDENDSSGSGGQNSGSDGGDENGDDDNSGSKADETDKQ